MNNRRKGAGAGFSTALIIGLIGFYNVSHRPGYDAIRSVDVLQLIGSGMCFGIALASVIIFLRGARGNA